MPRPLELHPDCPPTAVVGATGFIGRWFLAALRARDPGCLGTSHRGGAGLTTFDLAQAAETPLDFRGYGAVLLLGARTGIGAVEADPEGSRAVNVTGTLAVAEQALAAGARPVFFSSDYVFAGDRGGYTEDSPVEPSTEYGRQKAEVERRLRELDPAASLVVRIGKTHGVEPGDGTLLDEVAASLRAGEPVRAATDQVVVPTRVEDVVTAVATLLAEGAQGLFHVCGPAAWTRYDLALAVARALDADAGLIEPIRLGDLGLTPPRPLDTSMRAHPRFTTFHTVEDSIAELAAAWPS